MNIKELGGEFQFINRIKKKSKNRNVIVDIGDDCAVTEYNDDSYHLYTTDMLVEGDHFSLDYFSPYQIGIKVMESNASDIAAMGGKPVYSLISLSLKEDTTVEFIDGVYNGINEICERYNFDLIGGDTTHGDKIVISLTLIGQVDKNKLKLRSAAEIGDLIVVSGPLGGSTAGLKLFLNTIDGFDEIKKYHTNPISEIKNLPKILPVAKAMEDVSDGLASEIRNICKMSKVGAKIFREKIPLNKGIKKSSSLLDDDPYDYALFGGEDFKLVYTVNKNDRHKIYGTVVGEIIKGEKILLDGKELKNYGYDHFS
ncbi:MAG TPA: thiamine-phosphate kinase [Candidatus Mcinerneyibacterium sp.]|nr:thiamine-phosphate kinase [Candidatus Mcinerneyibacterium sp.]